MAAGDDRLARDHFIGSLSSPVSHETNPFPVNLVGRAMLARRIGPVRC